MALAGDTKVHPKFAFLLQTLDAGDEATVLCLETPTVAISFGMAKSVAVTVTAVQHGGPLSFINLLLTAVAVSRVFQEVAVHRQGVCCAPISFAPLLPSPAAITST